jgi:hypothetical protein
MFEQKTVIVVGAGASHEVGLPTGNLLKENLCQLLNISFENGLSQKSGDPLIYEAFRMLNSKEPRAIDKYIDSSRKIVKGLPQAISIDNYIDAHQNNTSLQECGKVGIVRAILQAEANSSLHIDKFKNQELDFKKLQETWYHKLFLLMTEQCNIDKLEERLSKLEIIIFNYDRCVEHFLKLAIENFYHVDGDRASKILKNIKIYHPYGSVGNLPWQDRNDSIEYGGVPTAESLVHLATKIKTFTEKFDSDSEELTSIRKAISDAKILLFLGFAYHQQNLKLMLPIQKTDKLYSTIKIFGTAKNLSNSDCELIRMELQQFGNSATISVRNDLTCTKIFDEYWRSLSLS